MESIKNNKWVVILSQLIILSIPFLIVEYGSYKFANFLGSTGAPWPIFVLSCIGGPLGLYFIIKEIYSSDKLRYLAFNVKPIYTKYGNFVLVNRKNQYFVCTSKWYILHKISNKIFQLPISPTEIERDVKLYHDSIIKKNDHKTSSEKLKDDYDNWSGAIGKKMEREKEIDKLV